MVEACCAEQTALGDERAAWYFSDMLSMDNGGWLARGIDERDIQRCEKLLTDRLGRAGWNRLREKHRVAIDAIVPLIARV